MRFFGGLEGVDAEVEQKLHEVAAVYLCLDIGIGQLDMQFVGLDAGVHFQQFVDIVQGLEDAG